mmetsp:Transcript_36181/g.51171  ORF Transcript_36181/g.51171 Transcript_36181/m.51171 type:complete len:316 (+) Transcript_36181:234-1181(+)
MSLSRVGRRIASAILILAACSSALVPFYRSTSIVSTRSSKSFNHYHGSKQHYHQQPQQHSLQTHHQKHKSRSNHALEMVYDSSGAVVAAAGAISGGLFAGGLHAIAGPDHLAALLPRCCGQRWYKAGRVGILWGLGHGMSATILGVLAYFLKNRIAKTGLLNSILSKGASLTEVAVGLSLIVIGLMGIKEAREWKQEMDMVQPKSLSAGAAESGMKTAQKGAVVFNGLLHGFSWDGAPSLAGALAVANWKGNLAFLLSYGLGTIAVMTVATTLIGEGTRRAGQLFERPDIPQKLSLVSSILAIAIGSVWCGMALV